MTVLVPKRPDESVRYVFSLLPELGQFDAIKTFTLEVTAGSGVVTISDEPTPPLNLGEAVTAVLTGGDDGVTSALTLTVNTAGGQVLVKDYTLLVADGVQAIIPTTVTKKFLIQRAFEAMGLSPYDFDPTPEEYKSALDNLDALMAQLVVNSLDFGYNFPATLGGGNLTDASEIPDFSVDFVVLRLARRLAPLIGKTLTDEAKTELRMAENNVRARMSVIPERLLPNKTPLGSGGKPWTTWRPFANGGGSSP